MKIKISRNEVLGLAILGIIVAIFEVVGLRKNDSDDREALPGAFPQFPRDVPRSVVGGPYMRGKLLVLETASGRIDGIQRWLPEHLRAGGSSDVGVVGFAVADKFVSGKYEGGGNAYTRYYTLMLYDAVDSVYIDSVRFLGGEPRPYSAVGEGAGSAPERDSIVAYLTRLPVWDTAIAQSYALLAAARTASADTVLALLERGGNPRFANVWGESALIEVLQRGDTLGPIVHELVGRGSDPNAMSRSQGETALTLLISRGYYDLVDPMLRAAARLDLRAQTLFGLGDTPLLEAVRVGHAPTVAALLALRPDLSVTDVMGFPPLHLAVSRSDYAMIEQLLAAGAKRNERALDGRRPLDMMFDQDTVIERLFDEQRQRRK